jgi:methionyl-tRNA formyltransferase
VQPEDGVTYAEKIDKAEARVDWSRPAAEVDRLIRGLSPFPGAWCEMDGVRVKLLGSRLVAGSGEPGAVIGPLTIACGEGAVEITRAQKPGGRGMDAGEFLRGFQMPERVD